MEWLSSNAGHIEIICGAAMAAWAFLAKLERSYRNHLREELVTKGEMSAVAQQVARVESKLDELLMSRFHRKPPTRRKKRAVSI